MYILHVARTRECFLNLVVPVTVTIMLTFPPSSLEWPPLASLAIKAQEPRGCLKRLSDTVRNIFNIANVTNPEDEGVIDHMVTVTTAMRSPFIAVACRSVSKS